MSLNSNNQNYKLGVANYRESDKPIKCRKCQESVEPEDACYRNGMTFCEVCYDD